MIKKVVLILSFVICIFSIIIAIYIGKLTLRPMAHEAAKNSAMTGIERSVEMFMVSTVKFQNEFENAKSSTERDAIISKWKEAIRAVDDAIIHDFGDTKLRVRLINDPEISKHASFGGAATAVSSTFERSSLAAFVAGRQDPIVVEDGGFLRMSAPLNSAVHPGCANCHGVPVGANAVLGTINAYAPLSMIIGEADRSANYIAMVIAGLAAVAAVFICLMFKIFIISRIESITNTMSNLARGEMAVVVPFSDHGDEIGKMSRAINVFRELAIDRERLRMAGRAEEIRRSEHQEHTERMIDGFRSEIGKMLAGDAFQSKTIQAASSDLNAIVGSSLDQARLATIAAAEAFGNVSAVATSAEQLSASINEISSRVSHTVEIVTTGSENAAAGNEKMMVLARSAARIGDVVMLIRSIAEQSNLLALNATIEAARAGEKGKGFAVVAAEVKQLANQTARATIDIAGQVEDIQNSTKEIVGDIDLIAKSMSNIKEYTELAAGFIEEQRLATAHISHSAQRASDSTLLVSDAMKELKVAANQTAEATETMGSSAMEVAMSNIALADAVEVFLKRVATA